MGEWITELKNGKGLRSLQIEPDSEEDRKPARRIFA